ncbi:hypothetical protein chiPu_0024201, partial [Chiloscyllium punctatum]|nr:hypothetical protein [Chiloscyllium punctatum]
MPREHSASYSELEEWQSGGETDSTLWLLFAEYFAEDGEVWTLPVVRKVHRQILNDPTLCHDDTSVLGQSEFNRASTALILGSESIAIVEKR